MKRITLWFMRRVLKDAEKSLEKETHTVIRQARKDLVKSYKTTIRFLEADLKN